MNDKQFTDELFRRMHDMGYKKAEINKGHIFFYGANKFMTMWIPRVPVDCTCFGVENQCIDIGEYLGVVDWGKVKVDTPIVVKMREKDPWIRRYFAKYENGKVYAWVNGTTSWSSCIFDEPSSWEYARLAEV